jgi:hypothetical protein
VYVDHDHACRDVVHASSASDPYCEIAPSLFTAGETVVHLAASTKPYQPVILQGHTAQQVSIMGPGASLATIAGNDNDGVAVIAQDNNRVSMFVTGVTLTSTGFASAAECNAKSDNGWMTLEDVAVRDSISYGVHGYGCHLVLRRSIVKHNAYGIFLAESVYDVSRSIVMGSTSDGIVIYTPNGTLDALTIVGNHSDDGSAGLRCDNGTCTVSQSIIVGNTSSVATGDAAQVGANVSIDDTVLGAGSTRGLACNPAFVAADDPHLDMSAAGGAQNQGCVFGHGGATDADVDGQMPSGDAALGADQPG